MESWCDQTVCNCAHSKIMERDPKWRTKLETAWWNFHVGTTFNQELSDNWHNLLDSDARDSPSKLHNCLLSFPSHMLQHMGTINSMDCTQTHVDHDVYMSRLANQIIQCKQQLHSTCQSELNDDDHFNVPQLQVHTAATRVKTHRNHVACVRSLDFFMWVVPHNPGGFTVTIEQLHQISK